MDRTVPGTPSKKMQSFILVEKMNVAWILAQYGCNKHVALAPSFELLILATVTLLLMPRY